MNQEFYMQKKLVNPVLNTSAMIVGIIGLLLCMLPALGLVAPALAIMLALLGRGNQLTLTGPGLAGVILGIIGIVGNILFMVFYVVLLGASNMLTGL